MTITIDANNLREFSYIMRTCEELSGVKIINLKINETKLSTPEIFALSLFNCLGEDYSKCYASKLSYNVLKVIFGYYNSNPYPSVFNILHINKDKNALVEINLNTGMFKNNRINKGCYIGLNLHEFNNAIKLFDSESSDIKIDIQDKNISLSGCHDNISYNYQIENYNILNPLLHQFH